MKTYKYFILYSVSFTFLFLTNGCNDNINLEPEGIITADGYFNSEEDYEKALNSVYVRLNHDNLNLWFDGCSDDGLVTHSWNRGYDLGYNIANSFSEFPELKWNEGYVAVQRANNIINNIDSYEWPDGTNDSQRNQILGEARTLRAYFYLDLVSLFGRIMFYQDNPVTVEDSYSVPQVENQKEVFDFILKELEEAIPGLPDQAANKSKVGKPAARLLRARAAAYAAGYLEDKSYFNITLEETEKLLQVSHTLGDYESLFKTGNETLDEVILTKQYAADSKNSWGNWYNNSIGGYCVTTPVKALIDAYEYIGDEIPYMPYMNKDPRLYASIYVPGSVIRDRYYNTVPDNVIEIDGKTYFDPSKDYGSLQDREVMVGDVLGETGGGEWNKTPTGFSYKKYCMEDDTWNTWNYYVVFRFAEAYLLRAEALVETGGSEAEVKELIQKLRDRAGNTNDIDEVIRTTHGSLLNLVRNERRIEMAQEGLRLYDLRRWKILLEEMNKTVEGIEYRGLVNGQLEELTYLMTERTYTEKDYWWPIPQTEIDLNDGRVTQNAGW